MQYENGGDLPRDGQAFEVKERWFDSQEAAREFVKTEVCLSMCGEECIYLPDTDKWVVLALDRAKDAVQAGA